MRLALLTYEFRPFVGGIGTYGEELARALQSEGHEVTVFAPDYGEPSREGQEAYHVQRFPSQRGLGGWGSLLRNAWAVGGLLGQTRPDWVLLMDLHAMILTGVMRFARPGLRLRTAAVFHGSEIFYLRSGRRARILGRPAVDAAEVIFANSEWTQSLLEATGERRWRGRSRVAGIGVGDRFLADPPFGGEGLRERWNLKGRSVLLTVARLVPRKGIDRSLRAFAALPESVRKDWVYVIGGTGEEAKPLASLVDSLRIQEQVRWLGEVDAEDLPGLYDLADLYVQLSREVEGEVEGLGITFLEAAARGLPALACRHGGVPEAVLHESTGILVPPGDDAAAARELERLVTDSNLRDRLGKAARDHVRDRFNWGRVAMRVAQELRDRDIR